MAKTNQLRIIGGEMGGRRLRFPDARGLRPTGERMRETLFNWLQGEMSGANVLDLFAGSGALGFEALSRGAGHVSFVEKIGRVADAIRESLSDLGVSNANLIQKDALQFIKAGGQSYNVVFVDPPFEANLWQTVVDGLVENHLLTTGAWLYVEMDKRAPMFKIPPGFDLHRQKEQGDVKAFLYQWVG